MLLEALDESDGCDRQCSLELRRIDLESKPNGLLVLELVGCAREVGFGSGTLRVVRQLVLDVSREKMSESTSSASCLTSCCSIEFRADSRSQHLLNTPQAVSSRPYEGFYRNEAVPKGVFTIRILDMNRRCRSGASVIKPF